MGYTTEFRGAFEFGDKKPDKEMTDFINKFSSSRRMARNCTTIVNYDKEWEKNCFFGKLGTEGEWYVGDCQESIKDYNMPPRNQPGLWCDWVIEDGKLVWNDSEKFYNYVEWLEYMIKNFFQPKGYVLNGEMKFQGEDFYDRGKIVIVNNKVMKVMED